MRDNWEISALGAIPAYPEWSAREYKIVEAALVASCHACGWSEDHLLLGPDTGPQQKLNNLLAWWADVVAGIEEGYSGDLTDYRID